MNPIQHGVFEMRKVPVWALRPGMEVARRVFDSNGFLLLNIGVKLEWEYIQRLKLHNISAIYIVDNLIPDVFVEDVILDETRQQATRLIRKITLEASRVQKNGKPQVIVHKKELQHVLQDIISQLLGNRHMAINLADIRGTDGYTFAHSVNVAVLAIITAAAMGLPNSDLFKIGQGALLHDLGKIIVPLAILNKQGNLRDEEKAQIRQHPAFGMRLLRSQKAVDYPAAEVVYQHHERIDGSGYPEGIAGNEIGLFSKIVAVADVYDALVSDRPYRPAHPPHRALEIMEAGSSGFDPGVMQSFYHHIPAYPVGTVVGLSDGYAGVVVFNHVGLPTRPRVRIFCRRDSFDPVQSFEVDLAQTLSLVVQRVYDEHELPLSIIVPPNGQEMNISMHLKNLMEEAVRHTIKEIKTNYNFCDCPRCCLDISALALNKLPPRYVVSALGHSFGRADLLVLQKNVDLLSVVLEAIKTVQAMPRHSQHDL